MGSDGEKVNVSQYEHYRTDAETVQSLFICFVMKYAIHTHTHTPINTCSAQQLQTNSYKILSEQTKNYLHENN